MADAPLIGRTALCQRTVIQGRGWRRKQAPQIHLALYIKVKVTESSTGAWRVAGVEEREKKKALPQQPDLQMWRWAAIDFNGPNTWDADLRLSPFFLFFFLFVLFLRSSSRWLKLTKRSECTHQARERTDGRTNTVKTKSQCKHGSDNCQHALHAIKGRGERGGGGSGVRWSQGLAVTARIQPPRLRKMEERRWRRETWRKGSQIRVKHSRSRLSDRLPDWWDLGQQSNWL